MQPNWAEENLQVIRTLMERAGLYRRALAPVMLSSGFFGVVAAGVGKFMFMESFLGGFFLYWTGVAVVAFGFALIVVRRQAIQANEIFWSPPTRRVIGTLLPPLAVGAAYSFFGRLYDDLEILANWLVFYGLGLVGAGWFISRGVRMLGWLFIASGFTVGCLILRGLRDYMLADSLDANLLMGFTFGGYHLLAAIYLYFTEKRDPTP